MYHFLKEEIILLLAGEVDVIGAENEFLNQISVNGETHDSLAILAQVLKFRCAFVLFHGVGNQILGGAKSSKETRRVSVSDKSQAHRQHDFRDSSLLVRCTFQIPLAKFSNSDHLGRILGRQGDLDGSVFFLHFLFLLLGLVKDLALVIVVFVR